jgi:hypothetical protein
MSISRHEHDAIGYSVVVVSKHCIARGLSVWQVTVNTSGSSDEMAPPAVAAI